MYCSSHFDAFFIFLRIKPLRNSALHHGLLGKYSQTRSIIKTDDSARHLSWFHYFQNSLPPGGRPSIGFAFAGRFWPNLVTEAIIPGVIVINKFGRTRSNQGFFAGS
jgi:hypothetical protein